MHPGKVVEFSTRFEEVVSQTIPPHLLIPEIEIDAELHITDIKPAFFNILRQFEPFGPNNMRPVFIARSVQDFKGYSKVVKEQHIKFVVAQGNQPEVIDGVGFNMADKFPIIEKGPFDMVFTVDENDFNGSTKLQVRVLDIKAPAHA